MRLQKGKEIDAPVLISGKISPVNRYQVKVIDQVCQGEHFNIYKGENAHGMTVCLKAIRYRSEKKEQFSSAMDYVAFRRATLLEEQKFLSLSYPCMPEPLGIIIVENDSSEDSKFFRKEPLWEEVRKQEPVFIQEFFDSRPLSAIPNIARNYSIAKRLDIFQKVVDFCKYAHHEGYILQNITPDHLLMSPRNDQNVYIVGTHRACTIQDGKADKKHPAYQDIQPPCLPGEILQPGHNYDQRVDLYQLGYLLYYLLSGINPADDTWWLKEGDFFPIKKEIIDISKTFRHYFPTQLWVIDLLLELTQPFPEQRIPDIETLDSYLKNPPKGKVEFQITDANCECIDVQINSTPDNAQQLCVRIETIGKTKIFYREYPVSKSLTFPDKRMGDVVCGIATLDDRRNLSWWQFQSVTIKSRLNFIIRRDTPPDKLSFLWEGPEMPHHVCFVALDEQNKRISLGEYADNEAQLPPDNVTLEYYKVYTIECTPYYQSESGFIAGEIYSQEWLFYPPIPEPTIKYLNQGLELSMIITPEQESRIEDVVVIHNEQAKTTQNARVVLNKQQIQLKYFIQDSLSLSDTHSFYFQVLLQKIGWKRSDAVMATMQLPSIEGLEILEPTVGICQIKWNKIQHPQLDSYEVKYDSEVLIQTPEPQYTFTCPWKTIIEQTQAKIQVTPIFIERGRKIHSEPSTIEYTPPTIEKILKDKILCLVSPFSVQFTLDKNFPMPLQNNMHLALIRVENDEPVTIAKVKCTQNMRMIDTNIVPGKIYEYYIHLDNDQTLLWQKTIEIPKVEISAQLQYVGYEDLVWEIHVEENTASCIKGRIEIIREHQGKETAQYFKWGEDEEVYFFEDKNLDPGSRYKYTLRANLGKELYTYAMGEVSTKEYNLEESIEVYYNRAAITWNPPISGLLGGIEIYDKKGRLIAFTKADSITLENLEPDKNYEFPLKYRYSNNCLKDGKVIYFRTLPYKISADAFDVGMDYFRLRWDVPDQGVARRIREFYLDVSGNVGKHILSKTTRSVHLKQLYPATIYQWSIMARLKSGSILQLYQGETQTGMPLFISEVEIGLVHHLRWNFPPCPAIDKIEIFRNDVSIGQTTENEMYDSDFKGSAEINYKFYYVLKDNRRVLADEKNIKPLNMSHLFAALQIQPCIGGIKWDFTNIRNFKYFKYIELYQDDTILYKQGAHIANLTFEDFGKANPENNKYIGLTDEAKNYRLAVVGVAPSTKKCKKKWTLNIKGIRCSYPDLPEDFAIYPEHCCIFFEWDEMDTDLLRQIIIRREDNGAILYQGTNQATSFCDDNNSRGLQVGQTYAYTIEMIYNNFYTTRTMEVTLDSFDPVHLDFQTNLINDVLVITWNTNTSTSIELIGWQRAKSLSHFFQRPIWTEFQAGMITIPLPSSNKDFAYQMLFHDQYGHNFATEPQVVNKNIPM
ncbi:MAG: hypothetical protein KBC30_04475 [Planctomycetes bacterium]|jgi:serine/threonine protein kinase|nr:hypothetical protein [Planctomycetota bacterium]HPY74973.1 hypothetical protein [Planctomycetota bacterium]HQB00563.1 hypothetical protein [Planctomycetota bacterium]